MSKAIYCGSGKKQNDTWLKVTINPDKLQEYIQEYEGNRFVKLNINIKDQVDQYGKDVSITVDTYKPEDRVIAKPVEESTNDDLPFN